MFWFKGCVLLLFYKMLFCLHSSWSFVSQLALSFSTWICISFVIEENRKRFFVCCFFVCLFCFFFFSLPSSVNVNFWVVEKVQFLKLFCFRLWPFLYNQQNVFSGWSDLQLSKHCLSCTNKAYAFLCFLFTLTSSSRRKYLMLRTSLFILIIDPDWKVPKF